MNKFLKICSFNVFGDASANVGVIRQLETQARVKDNKFLLHTFVFGAASDKLDNGINFVKTPFGFKFLTRFYASLWLFKNLINYQIFVFRSVPLPLWYILFPILKLFRRRIFVEVHTNESKIFYSEFKYGKAIFAIDFILRFFSSYFIDSCVYKTKEIFSLKNSFGYYGVKKFYISPNSIEVINDFEPFNTSTISNKGFLFVSSKFYKWQGLERLVKEVNDSLETVVSNNIIFHLVGYLTDEQKALVRKVNEVSDVFVLHGVLNSVDMNKVLSTSCIGLTTLDCSYLMDSSCSLKTREYLCSGLPVFSQIADDALPSDFPFFRFKHDWRLEDIIEFYNDVEGHNRSSVVAASEPYISSNVINRNKLNYYVNFYTGGGL